MTTGPIVPPNQFGISSQIGNEPQMLVNAWLPSGPAMLFCPADRPDRYQKALERADVVIDFSEHSPGSRVTLVNRIGHGDMAQVMRFDVARWAADDSRVPDRLSTIERISSADVVRTRDFVRPVWRDGRLVLLVQPAADDTVVPFENPAPTPCWCRVRRPR